MRVMTMHLDEALTLNGNDLCGLVPNEELFRPKHTIYLASEPRSQWHGPTEARTGSLILKHCYGILSSRQSTASYPNVFLYEKPRSDCI